MKHSSAQKVWTHSAAYEGQEGSSNEQPFPRWIFSRIWNSRFLTCYLTRVTTLKNLSEGQPYGINSLHSFRLALWIFLIVNILIIYAKSSINSHQHLNLNFQVSLIHLSLIALYPTYQTFGKNWSGARETTQQLSRALVEGPGFRSQYPHGG